MHPMSRPAGMPLGAEFDEQDAKMLQDAVKTELCKAGVQGFTISVSPSAPPGQRFRLDLFVRIQQQREVKKRASQIRREMIFWLLWAALLAMVLNSFTLGQSFRFSAKVKSEILEDEEALSGVSTREGVWQFLEENT